MEELKNIKVNITYGEKQINNRLKAYKAENSLKRAVNENKDKVETLLVSKYKLPLNFNIKRLESDERDEYSLIDIINSKLTNSSVSVTLNTYEIYKKFGIEKAIEKLHLQSNLNII